MITELDRYIEFLIRVIEGLNSPSKQPPKEDKEELERITSKILDELVVNPGGIIFTENNSSKKGKCRTAINFFFQSFNSEEFSDFFAEKRNELDELFEYEDRFTSLRPTFIDIHPANQKQFFTFYNEAMRCWLFGLDISSVIVISTLLENTLKATLGKNSKFEKLIDESYRRNIISLKSRDHAHKLRKTRNKIAHEGFIINKDESLKLVIETKDVIEDICS